MPSYHPKKSKPSWNEPWKRCRWHWEVRGDFHGMEVGKWVRTFWGTNVMVGCLGFFGGEVAVPGICIRSFGKQRNLDERVPNLQIYSKFRPKKRTCFLFAGSFFFFKSCFCGFSGQEDDVPKRAEKERNSSIDQRMPRWLRILNFHISLWNDGTKNSFDRFLRNKVNPHRYSSFFFEIMKTNGVKDVF